MVLRAAFKDNIMSYYPDDWAAWCRQMAMAILMLIGGMELVFKGKGLIMVLLTFMPMIAELVAIGGGGYWLLDLDAEFAVALGFIIGAVSPGVLIPILLKFMDQNLGTKKGIPYLIIGAASFDDVVAITGFMIAATFGFNNYDSDKVEFY